MAISVKQKEKKNLWLEAAVILASIFCLFLLLYLVLLLSFQDGEHSASMTINISSQIAHRIYESPTKNEIETISRMLRYSAHLGLFFIVGVVMTFVSMAIFRGYYRIFGVLLSGGICYILAYYTEYYKQFIEGRHFQLTDVALNWCGSVVGIACMVISYFMNRILLKL